jgi:predicted TIM-barrel fold metal-dependent hydrolase
MMKQPLLPTLPIIDSHHHLLHRRQSDAFTQAITRTRFLLEEYLEYLGTDHRVVASVTVASMFGMFRQGGPRHLRVVGEAEFMNGEAAMAASGKYGSCAVGQGLIGTADLRDGDWVQETLEAQLAVAPERFRGIRQVAMWDPDDTILRGSGPGPHLYLDRSFQAGVGRLAGLNLSFDALVLAPQLGDFGALARRFPETKMILNHVGVPVGVGRHAGRREEQFPEWRRAMAEIAACDNVTVKLGGLGAYVCGFPSFQRNPPATAAELAQEWRPYIETTIELMGPARCMFESNAPTDESGPFDNVCGAFKMLTAGYSDADRRSIFFDTANTVYDLGLDFDQFLQQTVEDAETAPAGG